MALKLLSVKTLRLVALIEGLSFIALLFVAMPLKYWGGMPGAVQLVGWAHGWLYVVYMANVIWAFSSGAIGGDRFGWSVIAGLLPFGTFVNDPYLRRAQQAIA